MRIYDIVRKTYYPKEFLKKKANNFGNSGEIITKKLNYLSYENEIIQDKQIKAD